MQIPNGNAGCEEGFSRNLSLNEHKLRGQLLLLLIRH